MEYNGELLTPERGAVETLPWGAVRVAGRNRPDTLTNPTVYNCQFRLVSPDMISWFDGAWRDESQEGSVPIETGIGWGQVIGGPTYSNNTGRFATVSLQLEVEELTDFCLNQSYAAIGQFFGDNFNRAFALIDQAVEGGS